MPWSPGAVRSRSRSRSGHGILLGQNLSHRPTDGSFTVGCSIATLAWGQLCFCTRAMARSLKHLDYFAVTLGVVISGLSLVGGAPLCHHWVALCTMSSCRFGACQWQRLALRQPECSATGSPAPAACAESGRSGPSSGRGPDTTPIPDPCFPKSLISLRCPGYPVWALLSDIRDPCQWYCSPPCTSGAL